MLICTPVQEPAHFFFLFPSYPFALLSCHVLCIACVCRESERGAKKKIQACVRSCIEAPASKNGGGPLLAASTHFSRALYLANALVPAQSRWSQRSRGD